MKNIISTCVVLPLLIAATYGSSVSELSNNMETLRKASPREDINLSSPVLKKNTFTVNGVKLKKSLEKKTSEKKDTF